MSPVRTQEYPLPPSLAKYRVYNRLRGVAGCKLLIFFDFPV
jgi:hypothetical protein